MLKDSRNPDLRAFFGPASVALIGATDNEERFAGRLLMRMQSFGYQGRIYPVNPRLGAVRGLKCYPSVQELPETPEHVGIAVPAANVLKVLESCAQRGVPFATIFTGGFAEGGDDEGRRVQMDITALARDSGMRIMGPNCNGLISFVDGFAMTSSASIAGPRKAAGDISVVSQSGGAGQVNVMWRAQELGLGINYQVSCGNSADLNILDFMRFAIDAPSTRVVMVLAETIPDGGRLFEIAELAAQREKPIVMLKLGRTAAGNRAAASHTGAVASSDEVCDAALRQCGIIRVDDCNELYETAMMLRTKRWPRGTRAAATTISGGNGVLLVDLGASQGLSWPEYTDQTRARLAEVLPKLASTGNPTDVTNAAIGKPTIFQHAIETIARDDNIDVVIPIFTLARKSDVCQAIAAARGAEKPVAVLWTGCCNDEPSFTSHDVVAEGVPAFRNTLSCIKAVRAAAQYGAFLDTRQERKSSSRPADVDEERAREIVRAYQGTLTERASKSILAAYGFPVTREMLAQNADEAVMHARSIGDAVALKVESPDIPHKTEAKALRLGVLGDDAVRKAFGEVLSAAGRYKPGARINGVLVQSMAPSGLEMMLGLSNDSQFGPVVVAALGGIHVEVLRDLVYRVAPVSHMEARAMLRELRGARLLDGVRGAARRDVDALCDLIVRLSWLGYDLREEIGELDINPLVVFEQGHGCLALDALIAKHAGSDEAST